MKIKILKPSGLTYWYANMIGDELEVNYYINEGTCPFRTEVSTRYIKNSDCVITELPESFCVKRCDDKENWEKYIQWLNKTYDTTNLGKFVEYLGYHTSHNVVGSDKPLGTEIHIDDMIKHIDYMERHINGGEQFHKESQLTVKMETQRISRQGLKEIYSVACDEWQGKLKSFGYRNPLENYIDLTNEEVNEMFFASNHKQKSILSKYLKQDDGSVGLSFINNKKLLEESYDIIGIIVSGDYAYKSFRLTNRYDWEIKKDSKGQLCLIPTKKK